MKCAETDGRIWCTSWPPTPRTVRPLGVLGPCRRICRPRSLLLGLMAFMVVLVQGSHPGLHPLELIDPGADLQQTCPVSHIVSDLASHLPEPALARLMLGGVLAPDLWPERLVFIHPLAPRPPPTLAW